jgi:hypothetical protein
LTTAPVATVLMLKRVQPLAFRPEIRAIKLATAGAKAAKWAVLRIVSNRGFQNQR